MNTPEHITRIIERLNPVDREALEQHLADVIKSRDKAEHQAGILADKLNNMENKAGDLGDRVEELEACCHQLTKALRWVTDDVKTDAPEMWAFAEQALAATPAANLAEVRAQAIEGIIDTLRDPKLLGGTHLIGVSGLQEHIDRIRKEAQ